MGPICLHGPHHSAQKSTNIGTLEFFNFFVKITIFNNLCGHKVKVITNFFIQVLIIFYLIVCVYISNMDILNLIYCP